MPKSRETVRRAVTLPFYQKIWIQEFIERFDYYTSVSDFVLSSIRHVFLELTDTKNSLAAYPDFFDFSDPMETPDDPISATKCTVQLTWPKGLLTAVECVCEEFTPSSKKVRDTFRFFVVFAVQYEIDRICNGFADEDLKEIGTSHRVTLSWLEGAGYLGSDELGAWIRSLSKKRTRRRGFGQASRRMHGAPRK